MRNLASVQTISKITPIEGKDRIALATIEGWQVIINKSEFTEGDSCVYMCGCERHIDPNPHVSSILRSALGMSYE